MVPFPMPDQLLHYNYNHFMALSILSGTTRVSRHQKGKTRKVNQSGFTGARVAVASPGPYANLHLSPHNHGSISPLSFLQAGCPSCHPINSVTALKASQAKYFIS